MGGGKNKTKSVSGDNGNIILNACLSFIHYHFIQQTKVFVLEKTVKAFTLSELRRAREMLFSYVDPSAKGYHGPQSSTEVEKTEHCFGVIYDKMREVDASDSQFIYACPSLEINLLPREPAEVHGYCSGEFSKLYMEMNDLRGQVAYITGLMVANKMTPDQIIPTQISKDAVSSPASAIPGQVRERLLSTGSKRRRLSESDDYVSCEEGDPMDESENSGFTKVLPKHLQRQLNAQRAAPKQPPQINKQPNRRDAVKGTAQPPSGSRFKGVGPRVPNVPKVFISRCDLSTEPDDIVVHLRDSGLKSVSSAVLATSTRPQIYAPRSKSFIITVDKIEDYRNLLSGAYTPVGSEVKKYYPPRENSKVVGSFNKEFQELEGLGDEVLRESVTSPVYAASRAEVNTGTDLTHSVEMIIATPPAASQQEPTAGVSGTDLQGQGNTRNANTE